MATLLQRVRGAAWLAFLLFALVEVTAHYAQRSRVVPMSDWREAAAVVRREKRPTDAITVAPSWADPILREVLGDRMSLGDAGRGDLAAYDRLWALTIRGARPAEAPGGEPELVRTFGGVTLRRWRLPRHTVKVDLVERWGDARVAIVSGGFETPCPMRTLAATNGGLETGPLWPSRRFACDPRREWLWVAPTVLEDLHYQPRRCIWQHPAGTEPIRTTFPAVPLGTSIVLYGGIYYMNERNLEGGPVDVSVLVGGRRVGRMRHRDGDGWKRMVADTRGLGPTGDVTVEVTSPAPHLRTFCWAATVRDGAVPR